MTTRSQIKPANESGWNLCQHFFLIFFCPNFFSGLTKELYYVREGVPNTYALNFVVPLKVNVTELKFSWDGVPSPVGGKRGVSNFNFMLSWFQVLYPFNSID